MLSKKPIAIFKMLYKRFMVGGHTHTHTQSKRFMALANGGHTHTQSKPTLTLVRMRRALISINGDVYLV